MAHGRSLELRSIRPRARLSYLTVGLNREQRRARAGRDPRTKRLVVERSPNVPSGASRSPGAAA